MSFGLFQKSFPFTDSNKKNKESSGFTLAEVLITLGIIGIISAMTLPTLINKYQEKVLVTSYLRVYSILNNAYRSAADEYGYYDNWPQTGSDTVNKLKKYLKLKDCEVGFGRGKCFPDITYKELDGLREFNFAAQSDNGKVGQTFQLASGEAILVNVEYAVSFIVDLNGSKKPNIIGQDLHIFSITKDSKYTMVNPGGATTSLSLESRPNLCNPNNSETVEGWRNGFSCGWWILRHRNMDYLRLSKDDIIKYW